MDEHTVSLEHITARVPLSTELRTTADVMVVYKALPPADLLIRAADRIDALGAALQSLNAAIDAMWNEGPTSDPEVHRLAITRAQRDLRLALEGR